MSDTRHKMISGMCMTYRHDYGLLEPPAREALYRQMEQIAYHDVDRVIAAAKAEGYLAGQERMRSRASTLPLDLKSVHKNVIRMTNSEAYAATAALEDLLAQIAALPLEDSQG